MVYISAISFIITIISGLRALTDIYNGLAFDIMIASLIISAVTLIKAFEKRYKNNDHTRYIKHDPAGMAKFNKK